MKLTKSNLQTALILFVVLIAVGLALYAGDEYDIPVLKQAHEGFGG